MYTYLLMIHVCIGSQKRINPVIIPPALQRIWKCCILGFTMSICPPVCPPVDGIVWHNLCPLCIFPNSHRIPLILHVLSSMVFRRCVACWVFSQIPKFEFLSILFYFRLLDPLYDHDISSHPWWWPWPKIPPMTLTLDCVYYIHAIIQVWIFDNHAVMNIQ